MKLERFFLLLVLFLLAACGSDEVVTPQATAVPPTEPAAIPTIAATATPEATATPMATAIPEGPTAVPTATVVPAVQAARLALVQELAVEPDQVEISAVEPVEWPDSCLGVQPIDALCAQVVTPGYRVTAEVDGRTYQINTDESGSSLVLVPGLVPPTGGIALTQEGEEQCTAVIFHEESGVQAGFCEEELASYPGDTPETAGQLNELITQYAPFHAQTPVGTINFSGLGDTPADPIIQRQIAELTRFYTDIIISGRASAGSQLALSWNRSGGIAGFCDDLAVYTYGLALASSCNPLPTDTGGQLWLSSEQLAQLYDWVDRFSSFEFDQSDPPNVLDGLSMLLVFHGSGQETATAAEQQAIADFAQALFAEAAGLEITAEPMPTAATHTVTGDAGTVVGAFLAALVEDETGQSSVIYLNQALQQQVSAGQTVPQLLGLSDGLSAYEYTITDNGRGDDTAVVEATLNETNPVTVTFTLTRQDDLWVISQITQ